MADAEVVPTRRQRKKDSTRALLHRVALELVEERGLAAVTVEDITERADVAPRTFFNYYASKDLAVLGVDPGRAERLASFLDERPAGEAPLESVRQVLLAELAGFDSHPQELRRRMGVIKGNPGLMSTWMGAWFGEQRDLAVRLADRLGLAEDATYPRLLVGACWSAMQVALMAWCDPASQESILDLVDRHIDMLAQGLEFPPVSPTRKGASLR